MAHKWISWLVLVALLAGCRGASPSPTPNPHPTSQLPALQRTASPTPAKPAGQPTARIDPALDLDHFDPQSPLIVHFDRPMQPDSDPLPLYTLPYLAGQYAWDGTRTTLTFTPQGGFAAGRQYEIYLGQQLASQDGASMKNAPRWDLQVKKAPRVVRTIPGTYAVQGRNPNIAVTFDRPMDESSVLAALSVQPELPYQAEMGGSTLQIRLEQPLDPGVRYAFTLGAQAADQEGIPLGSDYRWELGAEPIIAFLEPAGHIQQEAALLLVLSYPILQASWEQSARIVDAQGAPVAGDWTWENQTRLAFKPNEPLAASQAYRLEFRRTLQQVDGEKLPPPPSEPFHTPPPVVAYGPQENSLPLDAEIFIEFSEPVDRASVEAALSLEPAISGTFRWEENRVVFAPNALSSYQNYQVTLGTSAQKADGSPLLLDPLTWSFSTGWQPTRPAASFGSWGPNAQVLDLNGRRAVQFDAIDGVSTVDFSLHRLTLEQFLDRYASNFRGAAGYDWAPILLSGTAQQATWTETLRGPGAGYSQRIFETRIPPEVPAGLYVLQIESEGTQAQLLLVLTRNTLLAKQAEGQLTAWVTRINGAGVPGASVSVYARDGDRLAQGRTDATGVFTTRVSRDPQPLIVVAADSTGQAGSDFEGTDLTVSGLSNEWQGTYGSWWGWWRTRQPVRQYAAHIYTDRPIYRPGQTVYFKAMLRQDADAVLSLPPEGTPVTVRIRDARDNVVQTFALETNAFGTLHGEFALAEGAMLGNYNVEVLPGSDPQAAESLRQVFKVQDYRKPDYKVSVTTAAPSYLAGERVQVDVLVEYYFGETVANASLQVQQYGLARNLDYWWLDEAIDVPEYTWTGGVGEPLSLQTDENGMASFTLPAELFYQDRDDYYYSNWGSSLRKSTIGVEVTADDGSRQTVSNFATFEVYSEPVAVDVRLDSWLARPAEALKVHGQVTSYSGEPAAGQAVVLELRRYNEQVWGFDEVVTQVEAVTAADGTVEIELVPGQSGYYQLRLRTAESTEQHPRFDNDWLYVYRSSDTWANRYHGSALSIGADRESYAPGETAGLIIESTFSGPALLSFERGTTRRTQLVELTAPMTLVPVTIAPDDAPNIFVAVNAYQPQDTRLTGETNSSQADARLYTATIELQVPVTDKTLSITITPDRETYAPRQEAEFTLRVADGNGQPVQAELSLAVVDEAIYALSEELSGPILESFYGKRPHQVSTYNSLALTRDFMDSGFGGGGDDVSPGSPRADFPDTAFWFPAIQTDENGQAAVTVTLPDNLTSWRLTARAISREHQAGETHTNILTQQPVVVRPILPRTLVAGDRALLSAAVHNYSEGERTFEVSLDVQPSGEASLGDVPAVLALLDEPTQAVELAAGEVRYLGWWVQAGSAGEAQVLVTAQPTDDLPGLDAVQLTLPVRPLAVPQVDMQTGEFRGLFTTVLVRPEEAVASSSVIVELTPSIAGSLLEGLEFLTGYPYGCVEQTMSRALPNAVVGRAFRQLGVEDAQLSYDLPAMISAGLQRLYGYQHNDGGWGWWYDDQTDAYQTAWVVFGLAVTGEAGYEVSPQVIERGAAWLLDNLEDMDPRTRAFALYSLAYAGQPQAEANRALLRRAHELDTFSQAALALALEKSGDAEGARLLLSLLERSALQEAGRVYWPSPHEDGHYYQKTMSSSTRSTALALEALLALGEDENRETAVVQWLMDQRRLTGWGSTNETAFSLLALTDYILGRELAAADAAYTLRLNGQVLDQGTLGRSDPALRIELPISSLEIGANPLEFQVEGSQRLYYRITSSLALAQADIPPSGVVELQRTYQDARSGDFIETFAPGQLVKVTLRMDLPEEGFFLVVEDPLPGGLEALNENLNTTSHVQVLSSEQNEAYFWQDYGYNNKEIRGDRVSFFITQAATGWRELSYYARATYSGTFLALPATVEAMYDPAYWGRSASGLVEVARP